jgi:hypothetical protein
MAGHSVTLNWVASTDTVDGYQIFHGVAPGSELTTPINPALVTALTYVDTVFAKAGPNVYDVRASLGGVLSTVSNEVSVSLPPAPPSNLTVAASS